ncbi:fungal specific transcription factor domain-containing protein [Aspergillus homomorphus CBS 101889]|uniref:Xylanolytic transcriptional activator regulatory domain-containing protein n=1 Tax=Aspergillus homomorphus (strain CBS 101889) TaxID=1450537 RepID=A0A395I7I0_ASPHC|nr:hypothetical protein BO97DRAFT_468688 [Aspergillus homomorphus CBS 101889]RAL15223.1 hypothetical protein BO97DRAFT_468688 [Aspergillus homomorphus CBS 101889]
MLKTAMTCLSQDQFFVRYKFSTFEALLMLIYKLSQNGSVDQGWALLGMALNIGMALRCNAGNQQLGLIEAERRRRCWAGLLSLHTYQSILFRDVDMSFLLDLKVPLPANVNDNDITNEGISQPPKEPTQMSVMMFKIRLFPLSTRICRHISGASRLDPEPLKEFDAAISTEQRLWDSTYMIDGAPNLLDSSYAHWCVLQTYAHHLLLLLNRPFHHSQAPCFISASRDRCIDSSVKVISIHRQIYEVPLLRDFIWLLNGVVSLKALHAAVALSSCIADMPPSWDSSFYRQELQGLMARMESCSGRSATCLKAYPILSHMHRLHGIRSFKSQQSYRSRTCLKTGLICGNGLTPITTIGAWLPLRAVFPRKGSPSMGEGGQDYYELIENQVAESTSNRSYTILGPCGFTKDRPSGQDLEIARPLGPVSYGLHEATDIYNTEHDLLGPAVMIRAYSVSHTAWTITNLHVTTLLFPVT